MTVLLEQATPAIERRRTGRDRVADHQHQSYRGHDSQSMRSRSVTAKLDLPDDTIHIKLTGSAGQSLGAFLAHGVTIELGRRCQRLRRQGASRRSGHRLSAARKQFHVAEDNILVGNVCLYGATGGEAFFRGRAAERFCVRNSGAEPSSKVSATTVANT